MKTWHLGQAMTVTAALSEDCDFIAEVYNEAVRAGNSTADQETKDAAYFRTRMKQFGKNEGYFILRRAGIPLGWAAIFHYSDRLGYRYTCETATYLRGPERGKGLGMRFKKFILERCGEFGYHHVVAKIFSDNKASLLYNQKLGYEIVGEQKEVAFENGVWKNVTILQKILDTPRN